MIPAKARKWVYLVLVVGNVVVAALAPQYTELVVAIASALGFTLAAANITQPDDKESAGVRDRTP